MDAIFGTFDTDKNGVITKDEFARLTSYFPFLSTFGVLDANHDGVVSKGELLDFFLQG